MIEELKRDEIYTKVGGAFKLTALIQRRLVELLQGARPLVDTKGLTELEVVIQEIKEDKIQSTDAESMPEGDIEDVSE